MSSITLADRLELRTNDDASVREALLAALFGDRLGLTIFLSCLSLFLLAWRTSIFITDTYTLANGLYSLWNGQLFVTEPVYGGSLRTPGMSLYDGQYLARNYGVLVLSLPFLAFVEAVAAVTSLRIGIVALWALVSLALVGQLGRFLDSDRVVQAGSVVVLGLFALNVALATPLDSASSHLYALQLFHMTIAAFGPVLLYRLLRRRHDTRLAVTGAVLFVVGSPLVLWATVPKRHVVTATVALGIVYCLYRSREDEDAGLVRTPTGYRASAYALVMLYAWVHAPEALLLCLALVVVDLPTAANNSPRTLAVIVGAACVALVPFLVTNVLLTGSPLRPPRLLPRAVPVETTSSAGAMGGSTSETTQGFLSPLLGPFESAIRPLAVFVSQLLKGIETLVTNQSGVARTFLRSGYTGDTANKAGTEAVNLSVLESAPLLAAMTGMVPAAWRRLRTGSVPGRVLSAGAVADLFAATVMLGTSLLYISRLPIHAQITVRYLFVLYPLGILLLFRVPAIRTTLSEHGRVFGWALAGTLLIGGQLVLAFVALSVNGIGEAFQFHAVLALGTAGPLAFWSIFGRSDDWFGSLGAVLFGVTTALVSIFVWLTILEYYALGDAHSLPMVRVLGQLLELF